VWLMNAGSSQRRIVPVIITILVSLSSHPLDSWYCHKSPRDSLMTCSMYWHQTADSTPMRLTEHLRTAAADRTTGKPMRSLRGTQVSCVTGYWSANSCVHCPKTRAGSVPAKMTHTHDLHLGSAIGLPALMQIGDSTTRCPVRPNRIRTLARQRRQQRRRGTAGC
jgi:hypothetical protein